MSNGAHPPGGLGTEQLRHLSAHQRLLLKDDGDLVLQPKVIRGAPERQGAWAPQPMAPLVPASELEIIDPDEELGHLDRFVAGAEGAHGAAGRGPGHGALPDEDEPLEIDLDDPCVLHVQVIPAPTPAPPPAPERSGYFERARAPDARR
jgi:hypothetical protein